MRYLINAGHRRLLHLLLLVLLAVASPVPASAEADAPAATFTVNVTGDGADAAVGDGICDANPATPGAQCTLRAAIQEANATPAADTISLNLNLYELTLAGPNEDNGVTGDLDIIHDVTITGIPGATIVDGGDLDRVFSILLGANVAIRNVIIQHGVASNGGGVLVDINSVLTLDRSVVRASQATDNNHGGGAIYNAQGTVTLLQSMLTGNTALAGGAIYNRGVLTVRDSALAANTATIGGAIYTDSSGATSLANSTISGNTAANGGGLYVKSGPVTLNNTTVTANQATSGEGGGVFGPAAVANSLIAANLGAKPDCAGALTSLGYNLIGVNTGCSGPVHGLLGDQVGAAATPLDPLLGPLQDNGDFLLTHALLPGSPALDHGNPAVANGVGSACMPADARSIPRPGGVRCDVGAYEEVSTFTVTSLLDLAEVTPGDGVCAAKLFNEVVGCTLRAAIQEANTLPGLQVIDLPAGIYTLQRTGAGEDDNRTGDLDINASLVLRGAGAASTTIVGNATWADRLIDASGRVVIAGVTLAGGNSGDERGGGLTTSGMLTLHDCVVRDNRSADFGGGVYIQGFALAVARCTFTGNQAQWGGALAGTTGNVMIDGSTIQGNLAQGGGGISASNVLVELVDSQILSNTATAASGGGIEIGNERLSVKNSLFSGNHASDRGGGISSVGADVDMINSTLSSNTGYHGGAIALQNNASHRLTNVTISGNRAVELGGGLFNGGSNLALNNVTISGNVADSDNDGQGEGGGIRTEGSAQAVVIANSLLAGNSSGPAGKPDCSGALTSLGFNLVQNVTGCQFTAAGGDITGQDAKLGPLQANAGAQPTHPLLTGSPAIDAGAPAQGQSAACAAHDQRGAARTDGNGDGVVRCDIGAHEAPAGQAAQAFKINLPLILK